MSKIDIFDDFIMFYDILSGIWVVWVFVIRTLGFPFVLPPARRGGGDDG